MLYCCVVAGLLQKQTYQLNGSAVQVFSSPVNPALTCVTSHTITTTHITVRAVRAGRGLVDIYIQTCCYNYKNLKASSLHTYTHNLYYTYTRILE